MGEDPCSKKNSSSFWEIEPDKWKHLKTQPIDILGKSKISPSNKIKKFQTPGDHIDHFSTLKGRTGGF